MLKYKNNKELAPVCVPNDEEYLSHVSDLLNHKLVQSMGGIVHHGTTSCLSHSITVSYYSYLRCKKLGLNYRAAARGGLLHDFFLYDWHTHKKETGNAWHGFTHPAVALANAVKNFELNSIEKDIIKKHMWPLTAALPQYKESFIVAFQDKLASLRETFHHPVQFTQKAIGESAIV